MKLIYTLLKSTKNLTLLFVLISTAMFAHFGTKGPYGGSVSCGIADGSNAVYLGTTEGGVYESTTAGLIAWRARPVGLKSGKITALAHTGSYLFAGTADSGVFVFTGFIGSDRYWQKVNNGLSNLHVTSIIAIDSITLLVGTDGGGIFKTINKGQTWVPVNSTLLNLSINAFTKAGNRIIHTSAGGVWASDDKGVTWFDFNDVPTNGVNATAVSYNSSSDELIIVNANDIYISSAASTTLNPVYSAVQNGLPANTVVRSVSNDGAAWYLATDNGVFVSATGAISWISNNIGLATIDVTTVVPFGGSLVAGTNKEGVYKTGTLSSSWALVNNGFNNLETYSMAASGAAVIVAATEKGVFVSTDLANTYTSANAGLTDSLHVTDLFFMGSKLFAATANNGVFVSADTGRTWIVFNTGLGSNLQMKKIIASSTNIYAFTSSGDIYSSNGTLAWTSIQNGLPSAVVPSSMAFYGTTMLLGTLGNGVYAKPESGLSWASANTGLLNMDVTSVIVSGNKLFAGTDGSGVFVSDAATISWTPTAALSISHTVTMGLDGSAVQGMETYGGYVFASYKGGLLATADNGLTWIAAGNQFNLPSFTNVHKIAFVTTRVFVTTENNSLYSNALSELAFNSGISSYYNAACHGACDGSATVMATGGTSPYNYLWNPGSITTSTVSGLCAQTYTVTVTDANGLTNTKMVTVSEPSMLMATLTSTASTTGSDGTATATVSGGTAGYTYLWNNGGTNGSITGMGAGDYTVTITDGNGCSILNTVTITGVVGITEVLNSDSFSIQPNPSNGNFNIILNDTNVGITSVNIYDITGRLLENIALNGVQHFCKLSFNYPGGVYYIMINTNNGSAIKKVMIK
ncbi:MAG: T9SS type A sorting domain-containing protein [Bacteroidota bacterium]